MEGIHTYETKKVNEMFERRKVREVIGIEAFIYVERVAVR
jgi:hypothetical protein